MPANNCKICNKPLYQKDSVMSTIYICSDECKKTYKKQKPKHITNKCIEYWTSKGFTEAEAKEQISENSKKQSVRRIEYWINRGLSVEESEQKVKEIQRECSPRCEEYWLRQGFTKEEVLKKISEVQIKNYFNKIKKYSKKELDEMSSFSPKYWIKKGYSEQEAINLCKKNSDNMSKSSLIENMEKI